MNELSLLYNYLMVGAILFALGLVGFLTRRNLIVMFLCAEMMLQGVSLTLIGFGRCGQDGRSRCRCRARFAIGPAVSGAERSVRVDARVRRAR